VAQYTSIQNHPVWAKKSYDLKLTKHKDWQTTGEADDGSSNPTDQSDPAATWNTARDETSLASSSQPVPCLHGIWYELVSHPELLSTLISQIVMYLNDS